MDHDILCPDCSFVSSYVTATAQNRFDFSLCDFAMSIYVMQSFRDFFHSIGFSKSETTDEDIRSKDLSDVAEAVQVTIEAHNPSGLSGVWLADESVYEKYNELRTALERTHSSYVEWRAQQRPSEPAVRRGHQGSAGSERATAAIVPEILDRVEFPPTCDKAPHAPNWRKQLERERLKNNSTKQIEYLFLYAAEMHCVECMRWYMEKYHVDTDAVSCKMNARGWAEKDGNAPPADVHTFLQSIGL